MRLLSKTTAAAIAVIGLGAISAPDAMATPTLTCAAGVCTGTIDTTGFLSTELQNTGNHAAAALLLPLFDSVTYGTLTGVSVTFTGQITTSGTVTQTSGAAADTAVNVFSAFTAPTGGPASLSALSATAVFSQSFPNLASNTPTPVSGTSPLATTALLQGTFGGGAIDPSFIGIGYDTILISTLSGFGASGGGGNTSVIVNTLGQATIQVSYTYAESCDVSGTCVPEPASLTLLGVGLVGLGAVVRRRRRGA